MTLKSSLESLAESIATKAKNDNTPFVETIEALKALTQLFKVISPGKAPPDDEPGDGFTMDAAKSMIEEPSNGAEPASVRSGQRGRSGTAPN